MYVGRSMAELSKMPLTEWRDSELAYFNQSLQQITPLLNQDGQQINEKIIEEIQRRGGLNRNEADYTHGTRVNYD